MRYAQRFPICSTVVAGLFLTLCIVACKPSSPKLSSPAAPTTAAKAATPATRDVLRPEMTATSCGNFTAADAAALIGVPASDVSAKVEKGYEGFWQCMFTTADVRKGVSLSVTISTSEKDAVQDMDQLRNHLEVAGSVAPFKDSLPSGAYSDIVGVGDDAVWTDVNGTLTVRRANLTLQVMMPAGKMEQIKAAEAFLAKLR